MCGQAVVTPCQAALLPFCASLMPLLFSPAPQSRDYRLRRQEPVNLPPKCHHMIHPNADYQRPPPVATSLWLQGDEGPAGRPEDGGGGGCHCRGGSRFRAAPPPPGVRNLAPVDGRLEFSLSSRHIRACYDPPSTEGPSNQVDGGRGRPHNEIDEGPLSSPRCKSHFDIKKGSDEERLRIPLYTP